MKKCPACQSTYTDESLSYCLQDGVPLEVASTDSGEYETVVRQPTKPEVATVSIESGARTEESTKPPVTEPVAATTGGSKTFLAVAATALVMLVLFSVVAIAVAVYFNRGSDSRISANPRSNSNTRESNANQEESVLPSEESNSDVMPNPVISATPSPDSTAASPTPAPTTTVTPTPDATPDKGEVKKRVAGHVYKWKSLAESRSLGPYMNHYGPRIDYYRKSGASKSFVRNDKQNAFRKFSTIRIKISKMDVSVANDGKTASAVFDKEWLFANTGVRQTGKARSKLIFRDVGGQWKIVSERDLKVYYVKK